MNQILMISTRILSDALLPYYDFLGSMVILANEPAALSLIIIPGLTQTQLLTFFANSIKSDGVTMISGTSSNIILAYYSHSIGASGLGGYNG